MSKSEAWQRNVILGHIESTGIAMIAKVLDYLDEEPLDGGK